MIGHVFACTLVALCACIAALVLRHRCGAGFRHAVLLIAVLRFGVPTAWLASLAPRVHTSRAVEQFGVILLHPGAAALAPVGRTVARSPQPWLLLWALGFAASMGLWAFRAFRRVPAVRPPNEMESEILAGVPLRIVAAGHVPGACGWLRPRVVLPDGLSDHLSPAELRAVADHEMAHIRRHDNLWAVLVHAVVSVFWFHPLLWWMERRMLAERETACDEMVLRSGNHPEAYVAGLAKVCRMTFAGAAGYAGITGSNLATRMEQIMKWNLTRTSSPFPRALAGASLTIVMLMPLAAGLLRAQKPSPQHPDAMFQAGLDAMNAQRFDEAYEDFRKSQDAYPYPNTRGLMGMVEVRIKQGRTEEAVALLDSALAQHPDVNLKLALGTVLVRTHNYPRGLTVFQGLQGEGDLTPSQSGDVYIRLGETYRRMGNYDAAIASLTKAKELLPDNVAVVSTLSITLEQAGRRDEAARGYREVLTADPNNGVALNNLAYLIADTGGNLDTALDYAQRAGQALPNSVEVSDTLGWIYLKRNQPAQAFAAFRSAWERNPAEASYRTHLALAAGSEELKQLLRAPDSPENRDRIRTLLQAIQ